MIDEDRCLSDILGRSALVFRDGGLVGCCSDSEELEATEDELEMVGERLGRVSWSRCVVPMDRGSGYAAVAVVGDDG